MKVPTKRQQKRFVEFWRLLVKSAAFHSAHLFPSNLVVESPVGFVFFKEFLVTMTSSTFRPFRHAATSASLSVISALVEVEKELQNDSVVLSRHLRSASERIPSTDSSSSTAECIPPRHHALTSRHEVLRGKLELIQSFISDFFNRFASRDHSFE